MSPCVATRVAASVEGQSLSGGWLVVDGVVAITRAHLTLYRAMERGKRRAITLAEGWDGGD